MIVEEAERALEALLLYICRTLSEFGRGGIASNSIICSTQILNNDIYMSKLRFQTEVYVEYKKLDSDGVRHVIVNVIVTEEVREKWGMALMEHQTDCIKEYAAQLLKPHPFRSQIVSTLDFVDCDLKLITSDGNYEYHSNFGFMGGHENDHEAPLFEIYPRMFGPTECFFRSIPIINSHQIFNYTLLNIPNQIKQSSTLIEEIHHAKPQETPTALQADHTQCSKGENMFTFWSIYSDRGREI